MTLLKPAGRPAPRSRPIPAPGAVGEGAPNSQERESAGRVEAAHRAIKQAIRTNAFAPGYQAAEADIARQLGMSRTPVHEAMTRLQEEGLVRILPRRGILVCALAPEDIEEIYEVIVALEGAAAERLARGTEVSRASVADLLEETTRAMDRALAAGDLEGWAEADGRYHDQLVAECGNARLTRMAGTVTDQLHRARMFTLNLRAPPTGSADEHRDTIAAIRAGDPEAARRAARIHREHARDQLLPLIGRLRLFNL